MVPEMTILCPGSVSATRFITGESSRESSFVDGFVLPALFGCPQEYSSSRRIEMAQVNCLSNWDAWFIFIISPAVRSLFAIGSEYVQAFYPGGVLFVFITRYLESCLAEYNYA